MRRRVVFAVDIYAADGAAATEVQRHLTYLLGAPVGVDLVDTQRQGDDHKTQPIPNCDWKMPESRPTAPSDTRTRSSLAGDGKRAYELIKDGEANSNVSIAEALGIKTREAAAICTGLMVDRLIKSAGPGLYLPIEGD